MLPYDELQRRITTMVKGKADIVLYGNKSSGKTFLARKILNSVIGQNNYAYVKSLFISDRNSLMYLVANTMFKVFQNYSSILANLDKKQKPKFIELEFHQSLQVWIKCFNKFLEQYQFVLGKINRMYIFIDNIEEIGLSENFFKQFYYALKNQIKYIKISFFFCGMCHKSTMFNIYQPFRLISQFFMPRPDIRKVIRAAIEQSLIYQHSKAYKQFEKLIKHLQLVIYNSFQSIQYQTQYTYFMAKSFLDQVSEIVKADPKKAIFWLEQSQQYQSKLLQKLRSKGPVTLQRQNIEQVKKQTGNVGIKQIQEGQATFYKQNYPNLIMTSIGLANGFPQSQDIKRFIDLKATKSRNTKNKLSTKANAQNTFKQDTKKLRHAKDRIISISEVLEQKSCQTRLKQKELQHHSLDYYGCFEYLRDEGCINFYGRSAAKFGGTVMGEPKESEIRDFLGKIGLDYYQFTGRN